jgi:hypothetical protein
MKILKYITLSLIAVSSLSSCKKFLETEPKIMFRTMPQ